MGGKRLSMERERQPKDDRYMLKGEEQIVWGEHLQRS